jgi:hypothetical protein
MPKVQMANLSGRKILALQWRNKISRSNQHTSKIIILRAIALLYTNQFSGRLLLIYQAELDPTFRRYEQKKTVS